MKQWNLTIFDLQSHLIHMVQPIKSAIFLLPHEFTESIYNCHTCLKFFYFIAWGKLTYKKSSRESGILLKSEKKHKDMAACVRNLVIKMSEAQITTDTWKAYLFHAINQYHPIAFYCFSLLSNCSFLTFLHKISYQKKKKKKKTRKQTSLVWQNKTKNLQSKNRKTW
jgi:hypothetical protein